MSDFFAGDLKSQSSWVIITVLVVAFDSSLPLDFGGLASRSAA